MNDLASTGLLRYACDGYFWYASFASAFLLKVCLLSRSSIVSSFILIV